MGRSIEQQITVAVPVEVVWRALTEAEELRRWFPVDARVEPGPGGSVWLSWGPGSEAQSRIEIWDPKRRLRLVSEWPGGEGTPIRMAVDFYLEAAGGSTVLRLVHSGFGASSDWDDQYTATESGWCYFLFNLKHYLERHPNRPRTLIWERRPLSGPRDEVWRAITGSEGFALQGETMRLPLGKGGFPGRVVMLKPPAHLAALIPSLDDALLFVELESGSSQWRCGVYLSLYQFPEDHSARLRAELRHLLDRLLTRFQAPSPVG